MEKKKRIRPIKVLTRRLHVGVFMYIYICINIYKYVYISIYALYVCMYICMLYINTYAPYVHVLCVCYIYAIYNICR